MRSLLPVLALALLSACPTLDEIRYHFDLKAGVGEVHYRNVGTDRPEEADQEFQNLVGSYHEGDSFQTEHPGWEILERGFYEEESKLHYRVRFRFASPADAGLYQHDRRSPYILCGGFDPESAVSGNAKLVGPLVPGCVVAERKEKKLDFQVAMKSEGSSVSLLRQYQAWMAAKQAPAAN